MVGWLLSGPPVLHFKSPMAWNDWRQVHPGAGVLVTAEARSVEVGVPGAGGAGQESGGTWSLLGGGGPFLVGGCTQL